MLLGKQISPIDIKMGKDKRWGVPWWENWKNKKCNAFHQRYHYCEFPFLRTNADDCGHDYFAAMLYHLHEPKALINFVVYHHLFTIFATLLIVVYCIMDPIIYGKQCHCYWMGSFILNPIGMACVWLLYPFGWIVTVISILVIIIGTFIKMVDWVISKTINRKNKKDVSNSTDNSNNA